MLFPNLTALLLLWVSRKRQRRQLKSMEAWQLADIGVDRERAEREARKPCWRA